MFLSLALEVIVTAWNAICQTKTKGLVSLSVVTVLKRRQKRLDLHSRCRLCAGRPPGGLRCSGHPLLYAMFTWPKEVPPGLGLDGGGSTHGVYTGSSKTQDWNSQNGCLSFFFFFFFF